MAQSPSNLQEPSMDELLASIREIIEESSAAQEEDELLSETNGDHAYSQGVNGAREDRLQDDNTVPIQDAMKALAARIGLRKQVNAKPEIERVAALPEKEAVSPSPLPFVPPPTVTVVPASSPVLPATPHAPVRLSPFAHLNPSTSAGKKAQLSNNGQSVSVRPETVRAVPPKSVDTPKQLDTQNKKTLPQEPNTREASGAGTVPLFPQVRSMSPSPNSQKSPSTPAMIKSEASSPQSPKANAAAAQSLTKDFVAEFEQSAESLLRPYIASWLEAHFHDLFEKILREELQRLISQNLRR